jgi:hypothetical protein
MLKAHSILTFAAFIMLLALFAATPLSADTVSGTVVDQFGPVQGARVRVQTDIDPDFVLTDASGHFSLETPAGNVIVTAGKYLSTCGYVSTTGGSSGVEIELHALNFLDYLAYEWIDPRPDSGAAWRCSQCHTRFYDQWEASVMATTVDNVYVQSYYNGTDIFGNPAGFGYRVEHPESYGDCAGCHAPGMASKSLDVNSEAWNLNNAVGDVMSGIHCDWCHKVSDVKTTTAPPYLMQKYTMKRPRNYIPNGGAGPMLGSLDDIVYEWMGATYSPAMKDSSLCALCHLDNNHVGVPSEETFAEWQNSSYPAAGEGCPECHMEPYGDTTIIDGGIDRDPNQVHNHHFYGKTEADLTNAVTLTLDAVRDGGQVTATVNIENTDAGHSVPTGFHTRNMILLVEATDSGGAPLASVAGSTEYVPEWGGIGDPQDGNYAGLPGRGFAKVLGDGQGNAPVFYTEATEVVSDNRIVADATDSSTYTFVDPGSSAGSITVNARLLYRRSWKADMDVKQWGIADVLMEQDSAVLPLDESVTVETVVVGPAQLERGDTLLFRITVTNLAGSPVTVATRAEVDAPGDYSLTRGPVDIVLGPLEVHSQVYRLPIHDLAPFGTYLMDVIGEVGGSEADRGNLTYEVLPPPAP